MRERLRLKECGMNKGSGYEESRTSVPSMQCIIIHTNQIISHQLSCFPEWYWKLFFVPRTLTIKYSSLIHYIEFHNRLSKKRMSQDLLFFIIFFTILNCLLLYHPCCDTNERQMGCFIHSTSVHRDLAWGPEGAKFSTNQGSNTLGALTPLD